MAAEIKKRRLTHHTASVSAHCRHTLTFPPMRPEGTGSPIMPPIAKYIMGTSSTTLIIRRRSRRAASAACAAPTECASVFSAAPYPIPLTAAMTASGAASPSTVSDAARRETDALVTPGTLEAARSTAAEHAAHVIPVISYIFFNACLLFIKRSFNRIGYII